MHNKGYVKLFRKMQNWEWYKDLKTKALFLHLLLTVNNEDSSWQGIEVKRGSRVSSVATLAHELDLSEKSIRIAMGHLEKTGELQRTAYSNFTVFTLTKYNDYQCRQRSAQQEDDNQSENETSYNLNKWAKYAENYIPKMR